MKRRWCILLPLILSLLISGCDLSSGKVGAMDISENTDNLDPQYLTDKTGELVVGNIFEGLVIKNGLGEILPAAAERWKISPSGLIYTFYLRENAFWESWNKEETVVTSAVTANDFLFGLSRMFYSDAPSPYVREFLGVENGQQVLDGTLPLQNLGIKALSEHVLEIRLEERDELFLEKLTSSAAMPCNEEFFMTTKGRYGTEGLLTLSNGPYTISLWGKERITLMANPAYYNQAKTPFKQVNLNIRSADNQVKVDRFLKGTTQVAVAKDWVQEKSEDITTTEFQGVTWSVLFNTQKGLTAIPLVRQGFAYTTRREDLTPLLNDKFRASDSLFPQGTGIGLSELEVLAPTRGLGYNETQGRENFQFGLSQLGKKGETITFTLYLPEGAHVEYINAISPNWERVLDCKIKLAPLPKEEYEAQIRSGDFEMALVAVPTVSQQPIKALEQFVDGDMQKMLKYDNIIYNRLVETVYSGKTYEQTAKFVRNAESLLLMDGVIIPLYSESYYLLQRGIPQEITVYPMEQLIRFYQVK